MNGTVIRTFLTVLRTTENSRQYLLLRTDILQKLNSRWVPLINDLFITNSMVPSG